MNLESRLIINSNAFFTRKTKAPLVSDEYEKMFEMALMATKKPLPTAIENDQEEIQRFYINQGEYTTWKNLKIVN